MWTRLTIALALLGGSGCTDPGCIRNSECPKHFTCVKSVCTPDATDAGAKTPDAGAPDASVIRDY